MFKDFDKPTFQNNQRTTTYNRTLIKDRLRDSYEKLAGDMINYIDSNTTYSRGQTKVDPVVYFIYRFNALGKNGE